MRMSLRKYAFPLVSLALASGQLEARALSATSAPPNYWCTWIVQGTTLREAQKAGKTVFAGDQGVPQQRDNLNEAVLFGENGWATLFYPNERGALFLLLDGGWDLPYGTTTGGAKSLSMRGACIPHPDRFPSFKGTPAERLKALNDKVKSLGWRGIGVWIPAHVHGDMAEGRMLTDEEVREVLAEKMRLCKEAGVEYWKIDWGMRSNSVAFRRLMSDVRDKVYPGLILEHCWVPGTPLNDVDRKHGCAQSYNGRLLGNKEWCRNRKDHFAVMEASDVFRTYDVLYPFQYVTTLERCAYYSTLAEEGKLPVMLTIQERPYIIGPGLGHVLDIAPSGMRNGKAVPNDACVALAWQKIAPPFGHDTELRTRYSDEVLEDVWTYSDKDCSWFTAAIGKTVKQGAPAVVTRGLPLPEVKAEGPKPFVCGARYPNGAIALAFLPRAAVGKGYVECLADVTLDAKLETGKPLGVFGRFRTLTLKGGIADGVHIQARQLPSGKARDVTTLCTIGEDGSITIPLSVFEKPQGAYTPNAVIEAVTLPKKN